MVRKATDGPLAPVRSEKIDGPAATPDAVHRPKKTVSAQATAPAGPQKMGTPSTTQLGRRGLQSAALQSIALRTPTAEVPPPWTDDMATTVKRLLEVKSTKDAPTHFDHALSYLRYRDTPIALRGKLWKHLNAKATSDEQRNQLDAAGEELAFDAYRLASKAKFIGHAHDALSVLTLGVELGHTASKKLAGSGIKLNEGFIEYPQGTFMERMAGLAREAVEQGIPPGAAGYSVRALFDELASCEEFRAPGVSAPFDTLKSASSAASLPPAERPSLNLAKYGQLAVGPMEPVSTTAKTTEGLQANLIGARLHTRRTVHDGKAHTTVSFRLPVGPWKRLIERMQDAPDEAVSFDDLAYRRGSSKVYSIRDSEKLGTWKVRRSGGQSLAVSTEDSGRALWGYCSLSIEGDEPPTPSELERLIEDMTGPLEIRGDEERMLPPWNLDRPPASLPAPSGRVVTAGGHEHDYDPALAQACIDEGLLFFYHQTSDPETVVHMLQDGLKSSLRRFSEGIGTWGWSSESDQATGGGCGVFTRPMTVHDRRNNVGMSSHITLLLDRRLAGRLDWYGHERDSSGSTADLHDANFGVECINRTGNWVAASSEVIFDDSVAPHWIQHVLVSNENQRAEMIERLKEAGFEPEGRDLEEFVITQSEQVRTYPVSETLHTHDGFQKVVEAYEAGDIALLQFFFSTLKPTHEAFEEAMRWSNGGHLTDVQYPLIGAVESYNEEELRAVPLDVCGPGVVGLVKAGLLKHEFRRQG